MVVLLCWQVICNIKLIIANFFLNIKYYYFLLAVLGVLTQEKFHPLYGGKFSANPLEHLSAVSGEGWLQILGFIGILEYTFSGAAKTASPYSPGDFYGVGNRIGDPKDKSWVDFQTRELNNGRLAMFAIIGELAHAALTGKGPLEYWGI